jgi:hypothetical protein
VYGYAGYVEAVTSRGDVRELCVIVDGDQQKVLDETLITVRALSVRLSNLGREPVAFDTWATGRPVYGSEAYIEYGQANDVEWEHHCLHS